MSLDKIKIMNWNESIVTCNPSDDFKDKREKINDLLIVVLCNFSCT